MCARNAISPLRYPGGKTKLYDYVSSLIKENNIENCTYIEPFAGGSGLALKLLFKNDVNKIIINDKDYSIYCFWYAVLNFTNALCDLISTTEITMKEWVEQKHINNNPSEFSILEIGFSTLYLNRTNRSGILKAGVIGGKNQNSEYKMDCRFNKDTIIKRIRDIESQKHKIQLYNHDIFLLLDLLENIRTPNSLIYFDPPYYKKGPELYLNFFNHEEHDLLSKRISKLDCNWLLTYDNTEEVIELYPDFTPSEFSLQYSLQNKMKGQEVLFLSNSLVHPKVKKIC